MSEKEYISVTDTAKPDAPPLTEAEQARIVATGVAALEKEEQKENRRHYRGPRNPTEEQAKEILTLERDLGGTGCPQVQYRRHDGRIERRVEDQPWGPVSGSEIAHHYRLRGPVGAWIERTREWEDPVSRARRSERGVD